MPSRTKRTSTSSWITYPVATCVTTFAGTDASMRRQRVSSYWFNSVPLFPNFDNLWFPFWLGAGFFVACLVSGLEYFHAKSIIHRDIKPENLVIETDGKSNSCDSIEPHLIAWVCLICIGYIRITDFGIARVWREENAQDTSGTPGYMAPEVMCRQNHTCSVDFFAVGVMAFECMFGRVSIQSKADR